LFQILCACDESDLDKAEIAWIAFARSEEWPITNLTDGGEGALHPARESVDKRRAKMIGRKLSDETKARISAANKIAYQRPETRERHRGVIAASKSPEALAKLSARMMGNNPSAEVRVKMSASQRARPTRSVESRKKTSEAGMGRKWSNESREKVRKSVTESWKFRSRKWSDERSDRDRGRP